MKKTRIVSLLLLVVVCAVALCACQPAEEDFAWVKTFGLVEPTQVSGWDLLGCYPVEKLEENPYKVIEYGHFEFRGEQSDKLFFRGHLIAYPFEDFQQEPWGLIEKSYVAIFFENNDEMVEGYVVIEFSEIFLETRTTRELIGDIDEVYTTYCVYAQVIKSVKFRDGAIPFEQAQSVVESQLDLPQQSAN